MDCEKWLCYVEMSSPVFYSTTSTRIQCPGFPPPNIIMINVTSISVTNSQQTLVSQMLEACNVNQYQPHRVTPENI